MIDLTRRELLIAGAIGSMSLSLRALAPRSVAADDGTPVTTELPAYTDYRDVYRAAWRWDRVVRGTHLRANCFSACAWDLFVKDGVVWYEEQSDVYAREVPGLSDFAPRGCQKGACYSDLMTSPDRITHPMERVGPRGSGRWRRISWEQALTRLADATLDAIEEGGPETVVYDNGTSNVDSGPGATAEMRLFSLLGSTILDGFGGTGDLAMGAVQTWGTTFVDGSADDWMRADTLVFWSSNPVVTRMPDAHFATEARYRGTTVITVAPDYSPSSIHASLWVNPRQGSDAALALGIARSILERGAIDEDYIREQTDLPFLICEDTGRFLRQSDLEADGRDDIFYVYDLESEEIVEAPGTKGRWSDSLELDGLRPALSGSYQASTTRGEVSVRPVMDHLRERLSSFTPEYVEKITGVSPSIQERMADQIAGSRRTLFYPSWGSNRQYHADLLHRALILISALRGHHGRTGAGVRFAAWLPFSGGNEFTPGAQGSWLQRLLMRFYTPPPRMMEDGIAAVSMGPLTWTPSHLFLYLHAGLDAIQDQDSNDASLPRPAREYLSEALERGWTYPRPAAGNPPRVLITSGCNPLRRWPSPQIVEKVLWPKLRMIATLDFRASTTGMKADLLLPAAGYYEKLGIKYAVALAPYVVVGEQAVAPLGESKSEWEIISLLAQRIQERARERGIEGEPGGGLRPVQHERDLRPQGRREGGGPHPSALHDHRRRRMGGGAKGRRDPGRLGRRVGYHQWHRERGGARGHAHSFPHPRRGEARLAHTDRPPAVLPGPPVVLRGGRGAAPLQAPAQARRRAPHPADGRPQPLEHPRDLARPSQPAADAARRSGDVDLGRGRGCAGDPGRRADAGLERPRLLPDRRKGLASHAAWRGHASTTPGSPTSSPAGAATWRWSRRPTSRLHFAGGYGHLRYRIFFGGPVHVPRGIPIEIELAEGGADAPGGDPAAAASQSPVSG